MNNYEEKRFKEYYEKNKNKEYSLIDDSCFKYVLKDAKIAKELISCFDKVTNDPIIISSEVGTGSFNVDFGESRLDIEIINGKNHILAEAQNYKVDAIFKSFIKHYTVMVNQYQNNKDIITSIVDMPINYTIVFDNKNAPDDKTCCDVLPSIMYRDGKLNIYYKGKIILLYLKNIDENAKINIGRNSEKLIKFLLCFKKTKDELLKEDDFIMKQVGKKIEEFNNNYDEKIAALYRDFFEAQKRKELNEKDNVINEKDNVINEKDDIIAEQKNVINEKNNVINTKDNVILSLAKKLKDSGTSITEIALMTKLDIKVIENL